MVSSFGKMDVGKSVRQSPQRVRLMQEFSTKEWFVARRWIDGVRCPFCARDNIATVANRKPQPYRCRTCRKHFSAKTDTLLLSSKIPLSKWAIAFYLYATNLKGVSSMKLHHDLGITQKSAWYMAHRIREMWDDSTERFAGSVEPGKGHRMRYSLNS